MTRIQIVFKGPKHDIILEGDSIDEIEKQYKITRKRIDRLVGSTIEPSARAGGGRASGIKSVLLELRSQGFFKKLKVIGEISQALGVRGYTKPVTSLTAPLLDLVRDSDLRRKQEKRGEKLVWVYYAG